MRAARSAPAVPLRMAETAAGLSGQRLGTAAAHLEGRGRCARMMERLASMDGPVAVVAAAHPACPPRWRRLDETAPQLGARSMASAAAGTAGWARRWMHQPAAPRRAGVAADRSWTEATNSAAAAGCPPQHLRLLALDRRGDLRRLVATHPDCPPDALAVLSTDDDTVTVYAALTNPGCPPALLRRPSRVAAARLRPIPSCPPEALRLLIEDHDTAVRASATANPSCAPDVIAHAASTDPDLAHVAIKNPRCPTTTIVRLSIGEDIAAAATALQTLSRRNVQSLLAS